VSDLELVTGPPVGAATNERTARCSKMRIRTIVRTGHVSVSVKKKKTNKLHGLSPRANYTDRATAASQRSGCQLLQIKGATWSA
jgi:hypothetical protein